VPAAGERLCGFADITVDNHILSLSLTSGVMKKLQIAMGDLIVRALLCFIRPQ
jgi:hypothetical protein